jgi:hypothetical protein
VVQLREVLRQFVSNGEACEIPTYPCSGAIIDVKNGVNKKIVTVLTAAHCIHGLHPNAKMQVVIHNVAYTASARKAHPYYVTSVKNKEMKELEAAPQFASLINADGEYILDTKEKRELFERLIREIINLRVKVESTDIALLTVEVPANAWVPEPLKIASSPSTVGDRVTIIGYGQLIFADSDPSYNPEPPEFDTCEQAASYFLKEQNRLGVGTLRSGPNVIIAYPDDYKMHASPEDLEGIILVANPLVHNPKFAQGRPGDSGAPLLNEKNEIIGVVHGGRMSADEFFDDDPKGGIYSSVTTKRAREFIQQWLSKQKQ